MASIYDLDVAYVSEKLIPPELRTPVRLAWLRVLLAALQRKHNDIFDNTNKSFKTGMNLSPWSSASSYAAGAQVKVGIARYEARVGNTNVFPTTNSDTWHLVETDHIGTDARKKFYAGKMSLEYALNLYLNFTPTFSPTIYITTQNNAAATLMLNNNADPYLNYLANNTNFTQYYMANVSSYSTLSVNFIVFVPIALYNSLASNNNDRTNVVRSIVDRYNTAGITYSVQTY